MVSTPKYTDYSPYPFINGNNLKEGKVLIGDNTKYVAEEEYIKHKKELNSKTILMSINGTIGNLAYYRGENVVLGKSASFISLKDDVSKEFVYYSLGCDYVKKFYDLELTGSTIRNLSLRAIKDTPLLTPPLPEQQKIAQILTSVDEVIEKTQAQIDKLKDLKTGMMQELLTKGIGHVEFKDSPVGTIPVGWESLGIYDACNEVFLGLTAKVDYTEFNGVYLVRATDIAKGYLSFNKAKQITQQQHQSLTKFRQAKRGDILISKSGSLGVCALVDTDIEFSI